MDLTVRDITRLLNVTSETVRRWIRKRGLPARLVNEQYHCNRTELLEWAAANTVTVPPTLFRETHRSGQGATPSLAQALEAGGIVYDVPGRDLQAALQALVERLPLPSGVNRGCLFCRECMVACPEGAIHYTNDYRLAATQRQALVLSRDEMPTVEALDAKSRKLFGRSLKLREVCAGSCNGCEMELQALSNVVFDLGRFGIQFVASPRHADGLIVTGPVTENMRVALLKTYEAVPAPKLVIAVGACAISGGPFRDSPQAHHGVEGLLPVDL